MGKWELIHYYNKSVHPCRSVTQCSSAQVPYGASKDNDKWNKLTLLPLKQCRIHQLQCIHEERGTIKCYTYIYIYIYIYIWHLQPIYLFFLYFTEMIALLAVMTKSLLFRRCDKGPSPVPDVSEAKISVLLATAVQKGCCVQSKLTNY